MNNHHYKQPLIVTQDPEISRKHLLQAGRPRFESIEYQSPDRYLRLERINRFLEIKHTIVEPLLDWLMKEVEVFLLRISTGKNSDLKKLADFLQIQYLHLKRIERIHRLL